MTASAAGPGVLAIAPTPVAPSDHLLRAFTAHQRMRGFRPSTVHHRLAVLTMLGRAIAPTSLAEATRLDLEEFLARPLKPESSRGYRSTLKAFYSWAFEEGHVAEDPTARLPAIRIPRASPRPISTADLSVALASADARMRAWLLLMALGGLRCIEVAGLRPEDLISTDNGPVLHLRECKGGGTATMPAHPRIVEALAMIPIRDGLWWDCDRVSISRQVAAYLRSAGVEATARRLRHYAGTAWYQASGHDIITTATLLRHASIQTTQIYAAVDPVRPTEVVNLVPMVLPE